MQLPTVTPLSSRLWLSIQFIYTVEEEWRQHTSLSHGERSWFNSPDTDINFWAGTQWLGGRQHWTPATLPKVFHEEPGCMLSRGSTKHVKTSLAYSQDFSKICRRVKSWFCRATSGDENRTGCPSDQGSIISRRIFSRPLAYRLAGKLRREAPR